MQFRPIGGRQDCLRQGDNPSYTGDDIEPRELGLLADAVHASARIVLDTRLSAKTPQCSHHSHQVQTNTDLYTGHSDWQLDRNTTVTPNYWLQSKASVVWTTQLRNS